MIDVGALHGSVAHRDKHANQCMRSLSYVGKECPLTTTGKVAAGTFPPSNFEDGGHNII